MSAWPNLYKFAKTWCARLESPTFQWSELHASDITAEDVGIPCYETHAERFRKKFSAAAWDRFILESVLDDIKDVLGLASVIFEHWQNLWQRFPDCSISTEDQIWFRLAFKHLALLTGSNQHLFIGTPQRLHLTSHAGCFFSPSTPEQEVKQTLSIDANGLVTFQGYTHADLDHPCRRASFSINQKEAQHILTSAVRYCNQYFDPANTVFDAGEWNMVLSSVEETQYRFCGYLHGDCNSEESRFSELLRSSLCMSNLFGIDGNLHPYSKLSCITLHCEEIYSVPTIYRQKENIPECKKTQSKLIIDRASNTIDISFFYNDDSRAFFHWEHPSRVPALLNAISDPLFFRTNDTSKEHIVVSQNPIRTYKLILEREDGTQEKISGRYDKLGLPEKFPVLMRKVVNCTNYFDHSLFSQEVYEQIPRRKDDLIYCSVGFADGWKTYYYRTEDDTLEVGDQVVVPAGKDNHLAIVDIVGIEYCSLEQVPFPIEKTKMIIRRCTEEDYKLLL